MSQFGKPSYLYIFCEFAYKTVYIVSEDMTMYDKLPESGYDIDTKRKLNRVLRNLPEADNWQTSIIKQSAVNHTQR